MKMTAVSSLKPKMRAPLPREPGARALAMPWRSSLALVRQILALGGRVLFGKVFFSGMKKTVVSNLKPKMRAPLPSELGARALEVLSSTCQVDLGS